MEITSNNYYDSYIRSRHMSVSTFKSIGGIPAKKTCESMAMSIIKGEFKKEISTSMLVGSYVDSYFEGTLDKFIEMNPNILTIKGELRSEFKHANLMIKKAESNSKFMKLMSGEKQIILQGEIFGRSWIGKTDVTHSDYIVDLKTCPDINDIWCGREYGYINFMDAWGYPLQGAVYQQLEYQRTGKLKPFYLAVITKEKYPRLEIIHIPNEVLLINLEDAESKKDHVFNVFDGISDPSKCNNCDYCNSVNDINRISSYYDFIK